MPAHKKHGQAKGHATAKKPVPASKVSKGAAPSKTQRAETAPAATSAGDLGAQIKRLAADMDALKAELRRRPGGTNSEAAPRRDTEKIVADRLARLDEKIESLWGRVADLEEHFAGEGGAGRNREPDFDETPDRDFYEH
jgi:hypothetical protein